jgi:hypothetical protein
MSWQPAAVEALGVYLLGKNWKAQRSTIENGLARALPLIEVTQHMRMAWHRADQTPTAELAAMLLTCAKEK